MTTHSPQGFGYRARRTFTRLVVFLVILGLGGGVVFLLGQLNARTFTVLQENGELVVMKGRALPTGAAAYRPGDPRLADAYAPLPLEGQDVTLLTQQKFTDRDDLDRALFPLLETLARPRIASGEPAKVERGLYYLRRAEKLSGITEEQRRSLQSMLTDVAFYQARQKLEDARRLVSEGLAQLKLAAESENRHARAANQMLTTVGPTARDLEEALRRAVHSESAPNNTPVAPAPRQPAPSPAGDASATPPSAAPTPDAGAQP
ncbi:IF-2 protein [Corallococcus sp. AB011P]|uniref:IF-2 protein n=1 Tax=Corallococcus sp. AB011P TaxID=2316735 RepID=UPI000EA13915|nr:IF-2 protein [Corallococcus sp. AB011P]RKG58220.1 IF-2 protein [Corallococcus sp. AB011P]